MITKPRIEIDLEQVEHLAGLGLTNAEICDCLGISETTLYARKKESGVFEEAIKRGKAAAARLVSNALMDKVRDGDLGAIIWYEKTRLGKSDKSQVDTRQDITIRVERESRSTTHNT